MVSCVTFRIGFFRLAIQFFGIASSRPKYVVKGTVRVSYESQCGLHHCLLENKMISPLIWRHVRLLFVVQSNILWLIIELSYPN